MYHHNWCKKTVRTLKNGEPLYHTKYFSVVLEKYLWTSKTFLRLYIYTRARYVESHGHYRHVFHDRSSHLVDRRSTHFTLQQLTGTSGLHKKYMSE